MSVWFRKSSFILLIIFFTFSFAVISAPVANDDSETLTVTKASSTLTFDPRSNDSGTRLKVNSIISPPAVGSATINSQQSRIVYTPDINSVPYVTSFTYNIIDKFNDISNTALITMTVNGPDSPTVANDTASMTVPTESYATISVLTNDTGDNIKINSYTNPSNGTVVTRSNNTELRYTPDDGFVGSDSFTYDVEDSLGRISSNATVTVTVNGPPEPVASNDTVSMTLPTDSNVTVSVLANDTGDDIKINSYTNPSNGTVVARSQNTELRYTPNDGFSGTDTFTYNVIDSINRISNNATVTVTVNDLSATLDAVDDSIEIVDPTPYQAVQLDVLANDTGSDLVIRSVSSPSHGSTYASNGYVYYTPEVGYVGQDSFTYTISEGWSGTETDQATVTVTIVDTTPIDAIDDSIEIVDPTPYQAVQLDVVANDTGDDLQIRSVSSPTHGSAYASNGYIYYTPEVGYVGQDSFTYTISEGWSGTETDQATVTVNITDSNPLQTNDDTYELVDPTPYQAVQLDVLGNDTGDDLQIRSVSSPDHGSAYASNGYIYYTPEVNYTGNAQFTYTASEGWSGPVSEATVYISVMNYELPTANNDSASTIMNNSVLIPALDNDTGVDISYDATYTLSPSHGSAQISGSNILYDPESNWTGTDTFDYRIIDSNNNTSVATISVTVTGENNLTDAEQQVEQLINDSKDALSLSTPPPAVQLLMYYKIFNYYSTLDSTDNNGIDDIRDTNESDIGNIADEFEALTEIRKNDEDNETSNYSTAKSSLITILNDYTWN